MEALVTAERMSQPTKDFWRGKRVFLTGHTGFKGGWAALWLWKLGAQVTGVGLPPETAFCEQIQLGKCIDSRFDDIRNQDRLAFLLAETAPEIIIHMAAQSLVRRSFDQPMGTFDTNLMGTVGLLCSAASLKAPPSAILVVTSDKVYRNREDGTAFIESDPLGGDDPYSASKACAEHATTALRNVFKSVRMATARAGNVIGGGDFSEDRLIPDIIRAWESGETLSLRYPASIRPWQHVLDPVSGYLGYIEVLATNQAAPPSLNFGPRTDSGVSVAQVTDMMESALGCSLSRKNLTENNVTEKKILAVDSTLAAQTLNWHPRLNLKEAILWTAEWHKARHTKADMKAFTLSQIDAFEKLS